MVIYLNHTTRERIHNNASRAMNWHRNGDLIEILKYDDMGNMLSATMIHPAHQKKPLDENTLHCKRVAEECNAYAAGEVRRCPDCNAEIHRKDWPDLFRCPECGHQCDADEWEQFSIWDFLQNVYDIEFRTTGKGADDFRSVQIMVACGGPNIYLDTASQNVELYWWGSQARWPLSYDAVVALDQWAVEYWGAS